MMEKLIISNYDLAERICVFTGATIGAGYAIRINEVLEKLRPHSVEKIPISFAEAAAIACIVITQINNRYRYPPPSRENNKQTRRKHNEKEQVQVL